MGASRLKPLTVKEIQKLTATPPSTIKHRSLGGVPGFVLVHTPAGYTGYGLIYRAGGERKKLTLGSTKMLSLTLTFKQDAREASGFVSFQDILAASRRLGRGASPLLRIAGGADDDADWISLLEWFAKNPEQTVSGWSSPRPKAEPKMFGDKTVSIDALAPQAEPSAGSASDRLAANAGLPFVEGLELIIAEWIIGQHVYWAVGRSGDDTQRLRLMLDEGGWLSFFGKPGNALATPDRLVTVLRLMADCQFVDERASSEQVTYSVSTRIG